jgi:hypothetical protein
MTVGLERGHDVATAVGKFSLWTVAALVAIVIVALLLAN